MRKDRLAVTVATGWLLVWAASGNAAGGYGPFTPPALPGAPAAFQSQVQAAKTFGTSGGRLSAPVAHSARVTVKVPAHTFTASTQIAITAPSLSALNSVLHRLPSSRDIVATGFGIVIVRQNGRPITRGLANPITIVIRGANLGAKGERVLRITSANSAISVKATPTPGKVSFSLRGSADLIVANLSPSRTKGT